MGAATARMFAREGAKVVIADVLEHEGRQVADAIGASARFEPLDVTKEEDWGEAHKNPSGMRLVCAQREAMAVQHAAQPRYRGVALGS